MSVVIRIPAADIQRDRLKNLLSLSKRGRSGQLVLTNQKDGCYHAIVENAETALTFQVALTALGIDSTELGIDEARRLISQVRVRVTPPTSGIPITTMANGGKQRMWTGDSQVDATISAYLADLFSQRHGILFGRR